jgi:hypothetical protein
MIAPLRLKVQSFDPLVTPHPVPAVNEHVVLSVLVAVIFPGKLTVWPDLPMVIEVPLVVPMSMVPDLSIVAMFAVPVMLAVPGSDTF